MSAVDQATKAVKIGHIILILALLFPVIANAQRKQSVTPTQIGNLNQLRASQSHLALGVFYAREGMIAEAQREFQALAKDNPHSLLAKKFVKEIQLR